MLLAVAHFSHNEVCAGNAKYYLDDNVSGKDKERRFSTDGGFMRAVCSGTFSEAYNKASEGNREALIKGLQENVIEL